MGLLAKILPKLGGALQTFGGFVPGVGPVLAKAGGLLAKIPGKKVAAVVGAGAGFELGGRAVRGRAPARRGMGLIDPRTGMAFRRPKRRGLTANDIRGAQKVARLVKSFGYKPHLKVKKGRR
jgi:hypothetical protein